MRHTHARTYTHTHARTHMAACRYNMSLTLQGIISGIHAIWPNTHTFPRAGELPAQWKHPIRQPECADFPYEMWIDQVEEKISFRSHKDCCGWAVDFWPRGRDTCINIYAQVNIVNDSCNLFACCHHHLLFMLLISLLKTNCHGLFITIIYLVCIIESPELTAITHISCVST
jgi:hypothetical protein